MTEPGGRRYGFECPECRGHVPVSMNVLLEHGAATCPGCGLVLRVDREASRESLDVLQRVADAQERVREASGTPRPRRRPGS